MQNFKALVMAYKSQSNIIVHKNYIQKRFSKNAIFPVFRIFLRDRARSGGIFFQIRKVEDMAIHMVPKNFQKSVPTYGFGGLKHCIFFIFRPKLRVFHMRFWRKRYQFDLEAWNLAQAHLMHSFCRKCKKKLSIAKPR